MGNLGLIQSDTYHFLLVVQRFCNGLNVGLGAARANGRVGAAGVRLAAPGRTKRTNSQYKNDDERVINI